MKAKNKSLKDKRKKLVEIKRSSKLEALQVRGHNPNYKKNKMLNVITDAIKELRWWQLEAYEQLKDLRFTLIVAFCGSGKSILQVFLAGHDIVASNWTQKQLMVVPQQHIHRGFVGDEEFNYFKIKLHGKTYYWKINPDHNFCDSGSVNVLRRLKEYLLADGEALGFQFKGTDTLSGLTAVVSHQALGLVWKNLTNDEMKKARRKLSLRIDECHHVSGVFDENDQVLTDQEKAIIKEERTNLGDICAYFMNSDDPTSKIQFATATPYRGDCKSIITKSAQDKFSIYYLDWIKHFNTLGIEHFELQYEQYKTDPIGMVAENVKAELGEKHMIVIPPSGTKWRVHGKPELKELMKALRKIYPEDRILDLVTPSTQNKNKQLLIDEPKWFNLLRPSKFDVVVTCMIGREGTDWCPCSRLHNLSCENSITLAVQTVGRPFRSYKGKTKIVIKHYIPFFAEPKKGMSKFELLSDRTNALLVCMQLDEMFNPILMPKMDGAPGENGKKKGKKGSIKSIERVSLVDVFGAEVYQDVKKDLIFGIEGLNGDNNDEFELLIEDILNDRKVKDNVENVKAAMMVWVCRLLLPKGHSKIKGLDVSFVRKMGFNKLVETLGLKGMSVFFGKYDNESFEIVRSITKTKLEVWCYNWTNHFGKAKVKAIPVQSSVVVG